MSRAPGCGWVGRQSLAKRRNERPWARDAVATEEVRRQEARRHRSSSRRRGAPRAAGAPWRRRMETGRGRERLAWFGLAICWIPRSRLDFCHA